MRREDYGSDGNDEDYGSADYDRKDYGRGGYSREGYGSEDYNSEDYDSEDYDSEDYDSEDYDSEDYDPEDDDSEGYRSGNYRSGDYRLGDHGSRRYGSEKGRTRGYDPDDDYDDYDDGYDDRYDDGYDDRYDDGYDDRYDDGYDDRYDDGYDGRYDETGYGSDRFGSDSRSNRVPVRRESSRRPEAGAQRPGSGSQPSGSRAAGTGSSGTRPSGSGAAGTRTSGSRPSGSGAAGTRTSGSRPSGSGAAGTRSSGTRLSGSGAAGTRSSGTRPSGSGAAGTRSSGTRPSGSGAAGTRSSGTRPSGSGAAGTRSSGTRPSGSGAAGTRSSGSRVSGERGEEREKKSSGSKITGLVIGLCALLAVAAVLLVIFLAKEMVRGNSGTEASTAQPAADPAQANSGNRDMDPVNLQTEGMTAEATEAMATVEITEEPTTEELPDGTKHEMPTRAGDAYMLDGQVFSPCCAGHSTGEYYANMVNTVGSRLPSGVTLYDILAPTAFGACLGTEIQEELAGGNQTELIEYINSVIDESKAKTVPAYKNIIRHNDEYIYFNSDHHWTVMGAYYAYEEWCRVKGIEAHSTDFFKEKYEFTGFLGSFYSLAGEPTILEENRDTVLAYVPNGTNRAVFTESDGDEVVWNVVRDVSEWARTSKYNCFIGGDNPYTVIENPEITDGSACMLVKESYGNAFAPFLVDHYQYVYIIDYRYYTGNLSSFISRNNVQDVIILNNLEAIGGKRADTIQALFP